jgi:tRNA(fMet)-specific endonuclease VapC
MLRFLLDTDHLTLHQQGHAPLGQRLKAQRTDAIGVSVVTVEEALRGRLAHLARATDGPARTHRYRLLAETVQLFHEFPLVHFDQTAEHLFQQYRRFRLGTQDLKIAAIALANRLTLLTRNRRDFARVPGLALDDWSV